MAVSYALPEAPADEYAPVIPWETFQAKVFEWNQDQHIAIIGPTEQGKTNLTYHLLPRRRYVAYLGIKSRDKTLDAFAQQGGYTRLMNYPPTRGRIHKEVIEWNEMPRRLIWPDASDRRGSRDLQRRTFHTVLDDAWSRGSICVVWDDFWYHARVLGLALDAKQNLLNARSNDSAQVVIAQRGAGNHLVELFDQPTHMFFARESDPRNLQLLGSPNTMRRGFVANLDRYQFLYENARTQQMYRITAPLLDTS